MRGMLLQGIEEKKGDAQRERIHFIARLSVGCGVIPVISVRVVSFQTIPKFGTFIEAI